MCDAIQGQVACDLRDVEVGREEVKERPGRRTDDGRGEKETRRDVCLQKTGPEVKKMDGERGYEWEEGLFFLEEADPPENPVTKGTPPADGGCGGGVWLTSCLRTQGRSGGGAGIMWIHSSSVTPENT